jgi:hypothetical protein
MQASKEAKDLQRAQKARATQLANASMESMVVERPNLPHSASTDSLVMAALDGGQEETAQEGSEIGDDDSQAGVEPPVVAKVPAKRKKQVRKSKLAQEIVPVDTPVDSPVPDA